MRVRVSGNVRRAVVAAEGAALDLDDGATREIREETVSSSVVGTAEPHNAQGVESIGIDARDLDGALEAVALLVTATIVSVAADAVRLPAAVLEGQLLVPIKLVHVLDRDEGEAHKAGMVVVAAVADVDTLPALPHGARAQAVAVVAHDRAGRAARLTRRAVRVVRRVHHLEVRARERGQRQQRQRGSDSGGGHGGEIGASLGDRCGAR